MAHKPQTIEVIRDGKVMETITRPTFKGAVCYYGHTFDVIDGKIDITGLALAVKQDRDKEPRQVNVAEPYKMRTMPMASIMAAMMLGRMK